MRENEDANPHDNGHEAAASGKPKQEIAATESGEKITPPMLAPLYAVASAAGRLRINQGETIAFTAAADIATQPAARQCVATKSCHGSAASAQPMIPTPRQIARPW